VSQGCDTFRASPHSQKGEIVDLNLVVLCGRLSAPPEVREFDGGSRLARYLLTVRSEDPRRVDVLPVTLWDPPEALIDADPAPGHPLWVAGSVQRRFWAGPEGRRSRLEVVAEQVCLREVPEEA
jgi:single-strand DNA-binding protein